MIKIEPRNPFFALLSVRQLLSVKEQFHVVKIWRQYEQRWDVRTFEQNLTLLVLAPRPFIETPPPMTFFVDTFSTLSEYSMAH